MTTFTCMNKGCMQTSHDSLLDEATNEVICSNCGKPITDVTDFTKRSMIGLGHVKKTQAKASFAAQCHKCQKTGQPVMKNNVPVCYSCGETLKLTNQFLIMFKEYLRTQGK